MGLTEVTFVLAIVATTTVLFYFATDGARSIREAIGALVEWAGTFALFFALNLTFGAVLIFLIRGLTRRFVALYALENLPLLILSGAQAIVFQAYWTRAGSDRGR